MAVFIIVVASVAALASGSPASSESPATLPERAPVLGFHTYPSAAVCAEAVARLPSRPDMRFVCLPVEVPDGLPDAY